MDALVLWQPPLFPYKLSLDLADGPDKTVITVTEYLKNGDRVVIFQRPYPWPWEV